MPPLLPDRSKAAWVPLVVMAVCLTFLRPTIGPWGTVVIVLLACFAAAAQANPGRIGREISWFTFALDALSTGGVFLAFLLSSDVGVWIGFAVGCTILTGFLVNGLRPTSGAPGADPASPPQNRAS